MSSLQYEIYPNRVSNANFNKGFKREQINLSSTDILTALLDLSAGLTTKYKVHFKDKAVVTVKLNGAALNVDITKNGQPLGVTVDFSGLSQCNKSADRNIDFELIHMFVQVVERNVTMMVVDHVYNSEGTSTDPTTTTTTPAAIADKLVNMAKALCPSSSLPDPNPTNGTPPGGGGVMIKNKSRSSSMSGGADEPVLTIGTPKSILKAAISKAQKTHKDDADKMMRLDAMLTSLQANNNNDLNDIQTNLDALLIIATGSTGVVVQGQTSAIVQGQTPGVVQGQTGEAQGQAEVAQGPSEQAVVTATSGQETPGQGQTGVVPATPLGPATSGQATPGQGPTGQVDWQLIINRLNERLTNIIAPSNTTTTTNDDDETTPTLPRAYVQINSANTKIECLATGEKNTPTYAELFTTSAFEEIDNINLQQLFMEYLIHVVFNLYIDSSKKTSKEMTAAAKDLNVKLERLKDLQGSNLNEP